jgi:kumamolisin
VPDVAGDADPTTGYNIRVDGQDTVIGGTSAVAPLWAGLVAVANQQLGTPVGFIQPAIYAAKAVSAFTDITQGNNGAFSAGPGWDACTGLGSPIASKLIPLLAAAGTTPTPTPPPAPTPTPTPAPAPPGKKKKKKKHPEDGTAGKTVEKKVPGKKTAKKGVKKKAGKR